MKANVTIGDIAKAVGVSDTTVSWALNNHPLISKATKLKVLKYAEKFGYVPNIPARSLRNAKTNIIGVVFADISNPFYTRILDGIEDRAKKCGYNIFLCNTKYNPKNERSAIETLMQHNVDGIIVTPTQKVSDCYLKLIARKIPFVFTDTAIEGIDSNYVIPDTIMDGYLATRYLLGLGHRRIFHITGEPENADFPSFVNIIKGFKKALSESGIGYRRDMLYYGGLKIEDGYSAMKKILREKKMPTAIFAVNDMTAIGAMSAIDEAGLKIPDDVSIIGIDNAYLGSLPRISLTTIAEPEFEMGEKAVEVLTENIRANDLRKKFKPRRIILPSKLIKRKTCRKVG